MAVATRYSFWEFSGKEKSISTKKLHHIYWLTIRYLWTKYEDRHFFHHVPRFFDFTRSPEKVALKCLYIHSYTHLITSSSLNECLVPSIICSTECHWHLTQKSIEVVLGMRVPIYLVFDTDVCLFRKIKDSTEMQCDGCDVLRIYCCRTNSSFALFGQPLKPFELSILSPKSS